MNSSSTLRMLETVARALASIKDEVVFLGGATVALYLQDPASPEIRPTDDVDCIVELASYSSYAGLESRLRTLGFVNDTSPNAPICRWLYEGIKVDVMPTDGSILGFTNQFYKDGMAQKVPQALPDGAEIFILAAPYFLATKIEAFLDRSGGDFRFSSDMEDIVALLDGRSALLEELRTAPSPVPGYIARHFQSFLASPAFLESIEGYLPAAREGRRRQQRVLAIMREIVHERAGRI